MVFKIEIELESWILGTDLFLFEVHSLRRLEADWELDCKNVRSKHLGISECGIHHLMICQILIRRER